MIDDRVYQITQEIKDAIVEKLRADRLDASGNLSKSVEAYFDINGDTYSVVIELDEYWKYLENGRGPGKFPPPDSIKEWIRFKHIVPKALSSKQVPSTDQLAYLIGRKIATFGTKATHFLTETLESPHVQELLDEISDLVSEDVISIIINEIDNLNKL